MIKGVIFDLDGTLADTLPDLEDAMNRMLMQFGFPIRTRKEHRDAICYGAREFVRRSLPESKRDEDTVNCALAAYRTYYIAACTAKTKVYPRITELLSRLCTNGVWVAVQSNKPMAQTVQVVKHYFPQIPFTAVLGHVEGTPVKPDPQAALSIAEKMGLDPCEIAFVGDSDVDMQTARNAGMLPVGVLWGYRDRKTLIAKGEVPLAENAEELETLLLKM
ncbi:MAG: HAD family hydrolase [Ruminococcaceae bacterium]|nr:HAD family hydrolase [Oscillospiraceae bacterium]